MLPALFPAPAAERRPARPQTYNMALPSLLHFRTTWWHSYNCGRQKPQHACTTIPSGFQSATISTLTRAFRLPLPVPAAPGMAGCTLGLWAFIHFHPRLGGRLGGGQRPRGLCRRVGGTAALAWAGGGARAVRRGGRAFAEGLPRGARVSRAAASRCCDTEPRFPPARRPRRLAAGVELRGC